MCGIIVKENSKINNIELLNHRGGNNSHIDKINNFSFAHNRLKLTGDLIQPFQSNGIMAVVNGEFYDYQPFIKEFGLTSNCDSEIIIPLYEKYGLNFIDYLNGEFSFVLYDSNKDILIFSRDRFGVKPLYFRLDENIHISSEIKVFDNLAFSDLSNTFSMQYSKENIFNVSEVKPGRLYLYQNGKLSTKEYFTYNIGTSKSTIRTSMIDAVAKRIENQDVSLTLSGGIDSALLSSISSHILNRDIETFSVAFVDNDKFNEIDDIKKIIEHNNISKSNILYLDQETLFDNLEEAVIASEGISVNIHVSAKYLLFKRIAEEGYKINISGEGSDELFWGYQHLVSEVHDVEVPEILKGYMNSSIDGINHTNLKYVPEFMKGKFEIGSIIHSIFLKNKIIEKVDFNINLEKPFLSHKLWLDLCFSPYILTTLGDKIEMAHNIEGRLPFLDKKLIEESFSTDLKYKLNKIQLKDEFKDILPSFLIDKPKHPFIGPQLLSNKNVKEKIRILVRDDFNRDRFDIKSILDNLDLMANDITFNSAMMICLSVHYLEKNMIKLKS